MTNKISMDLTLILGPMKSGKSFDLISHFAPLQYADISHVLYQSVRNVRDEKIFSRNGVGIEARKIKSLHEALDHDFSVVGIDEVHMFEPDDVKAISVLLKRGVKVISAGLDMDYKGELFEVVRRLFELAPKEVKYKRSVCEVCHKFSGAYTQVYHNNAPITDGFPSVIPEDGTFTYKPVCHHCFVAATAAAPLHSGA